MTTDNPEQCPSTGDLLPREVEILRRFESLKEYIGWTAADDAHAELLTRVLAPYGAMLADDFYAQIENHPAAYRVITGGAAQIQRLKESLIAWLVDTLKSRHNADYVLRRWRIGRRHVEIGLDQLYVSAAFARVRARMNDLICHSADLSMEERIQAHLSLNKRLDLELAIMSDAYQREYQSRQLPVDQARLQQQKLLAILSEEALAGASLNVIFDQAVVYLTRAFQADQCEYLELDRTQRTLRLKSASGWPVWKIGEIVGRLENSAQLNHLDQWKGCREIEDLQFRNSPLPLPAWTDPQMVSSLDVVVRSESGVWGVLGVHFRQRRQFRPSDHDFLVSIAHLLANAVHRKRIEKQRAESENQLRRLVERLPAGAVYVIQGTLHVNQAVEAMTGCSRDQLRQLEDWNRLVLEQTVGEDPQELPGVHHEGRIVQSQLRIRHLDGRDRLLSQVKFQSGTDEIWLLHDVTQEAEYHRRQLQSERLAAIGQMITGLAHESRNALQRMQACTEMLELEVEGNTQALSLITRLQQAQDDLQLLFDEVRNYASPLKLEPAPVKLSDLIRQAWDQLEPSRKQRKGGLQFLGDSAEVELFVDRFRMVQVFRNFFENSLAACSDPCEISLEVRVFPRESGRQLELTLRDNGPGLAASVAAKVFEPFFTTKPKGSGLGMAIASRIITAHHGDVLAFSHPGRGAEFRIILPLDSRETH